MRKQPRPAGAVAAAALLAAAAAALLAPAPADAGKDGWVQLFNGKDLDGWDTWLGRPHKGKEVVGLNQDPSKVYSDVDVEGEQQGKVIVFKKGGQKFTVPNKETGPRIVKSADYENPTGRWNTVELLTVGGTSVHKVNGKVNMVLTNSRRRVAGKEEPL